jgi:hypothetical protein
MIQLINNIEGQIYTVNTGVIRTFKKISGEIQREDFIDLNDLKYFTQNFSKIQNTESLLNPLNFGLKNINNIPTVNLEINY